MVAPNHETRAPTICVECRHHMPHPTRPCANGKDNIDKCAANPRQPGRRDFVTGARLAPEFWFCENKNNDGECPDFEPKNGEA